MPMKVALPTVPNAKGLPGFIATFQSAKVPCAAIAFLM